MRDLKHSHTGTLKGNKHIISVYHMACGAFFGMKCRLWPWKKEAKCTCAPLDDVSPGMSSRVPLQPISVRSATVRSSSLNRIKLQGNC